MPIRRRGPRKGRKYKLRVLPTRAAVLAHAARRRLRRTSFTTPPPIYPYTRGRTFNIDLKDQSGHPGLILTTDGGVVWNVEAALSELPDYQEFTNLYSQYRLKALSIKFYPIISETTLGNSENLLIRSTTSRTGRALAAANTEADWLQLQKSKTRVMPKGGRPITYYMKLNQLNKVFSDVASGTEDYTIVSPKFISTEESSTPHYGMQLRFDCTSFANINNIANGNGQFKVEMKYYLQCRKVE